MSVDPALFCANAWLASLKPETRAALAKSAMVRRLSHGQQWTSRTEPARGIALILEGGLRSTTVTADGKEYVFSIMKKGDIWGLVSTIDRIENANDVYAHGETTILTIERRSANALIDAYPDFSRCLMEILCQRLRMANAVIEDRALKSIDVRLARLLLSLRGSAKDGLSPDELHITHEMLAKILGCTRPTVNKRLRDLELEDIIDASYGRIVVKDIARLQAISGKGDYFYF